MSNQGDLISRSALKEELPNLWNYDADHFIFKQIETLIDNAPTVEYTFEEAFQKTVCEQKLYCPSRPQGEWVRKVDEVGFISHICSECGAEIEVEDCSDDKFCFNCGAKMKGGADNV